jgi:hypothetical protein
MSLHPDFPVVSGDHVLTREWTLTLPGEFNRRIEEGSLVLWQPELTFWINIWNNDAGLPPEDQLARILAEASPERRDEQVGRAAGLIRLSYELAEADPERDASEYNSISGHIISPTDYVQISAYYDTPAARTLGYQVLHSLRRSTP